MDKLLKAIKLPNLSGQLLAKSLRTGLGCGSVSVKIYTDNMISFCHLKIFWALSHQPVSFYLETHGIAIEQHGSKWSPEAYKWKPKPVSEIAKYIQV